MANDYTGTADLTGAVPTFYSKKFLQRLVPKLRMMDYCMKKPLPEGNGTVMYFPRMTNLSTTVSAFKIEYSAGREPISPEALASAQVSATLEKYGNSVAILDVTRLAAINETVTEATNTLADQAGTILDKRIIQEANGTSATPTGAGFSCFFFNTVGKVDLGSSTSAGPTYAGTVEYGMTAKTVRAAMKKMLARNVESLDTGYFGFVMHVNQGMALQADSEWQTAYQYTDPENIRKGVAGEYAGARIQIDNNITTSANGSNGNTLYYSLLLGRGAMGVSELNGGVKFYTSGTGADKYDTIDEFITLGWKALMVPARLNVSSGLIVVTAEA
jgi:N4-gp56 family major capsid protein